MRGSFLTIFLAFSLLLAGSAVFAQNEITGEVYTIKTKKHKQPLEGAMVTAIGTNAGATTDSSGRFSITIPDTVTVLRISYVGYLTDTFILSPGQTTVSIELIQQHDLKEVVIRNKMKSTEISMLDPIKMEKIGQTELYKAACCNLSESFETTPSVDVSFTDAVTGYKQIKLLGLAGPYTLITRENIPDVRGLAAITGLTFTPGTWIESMQLSKGTGSVVNGFESVAGQINVELRKPFAADRAIFNLYQSSQGRTEANAVVAHKFSDKLSTGLMLHFNSQWAKTDLNNDNYVDAPLGNQLNILNRWTYNSTSGWMFQAGVKYLYTKVVGGALNYTEGTPQIQGNPWGYTNSISRLEDWAKIAKVFKSRPATSIGLQLSNTNHDQQSLFGTRDYTACQNSFYANLIFQTYINSTSHIIKVGASEMIDNYKETFEQNTYTRQEQVTGAFAEYAWNPSSKFNAVAGLRYDHNNLFGGFATPRLHLRYAPFKKTVIRASAGRAQRTANILAENAGFMAGNRRFIIPSTTNAYGLNPEVAWNTGINLTHKFKLGLREAVLSFDYYYTWFQDQVVTDVEYTGFVKFYNLAGKSYAHSFQAQFDYELLHNLNLRAAYRYLNIMTTYTDGLKEKPLVPQHRAFINADYTTRSKWKFDYTVQWISEQRTPGIDHRHTGLTPGGPNTSPSYILMNAQITKVLSPAFDVYLGCDNITNYMQHDAIINPTSPFSPGFDASMIWGPMMGRNIFTGVRYRIK